MIFENQIIFHSIFDFSLIFFASLLKINLFSFFYSYVKIINFFYKYDLDYFFDFELKH
jgi:hypothetical protein